MKSVAFDARNDCTLLFISFPSVQDSFVSDRIIIYHSNLPCASTRSYSTLKCWVLGLELSMRSESVFARTFFYRVTYLL